MATNTPICVKTECSNEAAFNEFFPDSDGGQYWTMCDKCYNKEHCSHKFECGCEKQSCLEMGLDKCDEDFCDNESCRHYYNHRNDNCDCGRCGYCDSDLDE